MSILNDKFKRKISNMKLTRVLYNITAMGTIRQTEKEVTIKAPWGKIAGLTWGDPKNPPVFLCPGRIEPCSAFRPLVLRLPQNFFYVSVDLPGNGFSDHFPKGLRFTLLDFLPTVLTVVEHFQWQKFAYIGHSLGAAIGKHFDMAYPSRITRIVDLDPVPAYHVVLPTPSHMQAWYQEIYGSHYSDKAYKKHTGDKESAPKYTYQKIKDLLIKTQELTDEAAEVILERYLEPTGDGLFRLTYDQRMKSTFILPFTPEQLRQLYTASTIPTLSIFAKDVIDFGVYKYVPFTQDETAWPNNNYTCMTVKGGHDVHVNDPGCMAEEISMFLLVDFRAKL